MSWAGSAETVPVHPHPAPIRMPSSSVPTCEAGLAFLAVKVLLQVMTTFLVWRAKGLIDRTIASILDLMALSSYPWKVVTCPCYQTETAPIVVMMSMLGTHPWAVLRNGAVLLPLTWTVLPGSFRAKLRGALSGSDQYLLFLSCSPY